MPGTDAQKREKQLTFFDAGLDKPSEPLTEPKIVQSRFSNYVVYVDESGDHGMLNIDQSYPLFVLAFCVFYKKHYAERVVSALEKFKFSNFGHDIVILHEREIRKEMHPFKFGSAFERKQFMSGLTDIIDESNFVLISCVIDKTRFRTRMDVGENPYHIALGFCLETLHEFLEEKGQHEKRTHVVVEARGKKEDRDLELEFRRICDGDNKMGRILPFEVVFADKKANSSGLQLADLVARPIGMSILRPGQANRAFDVLKLKFFCSGGRDKVGEGYENWGLKLFPNPGPESEKPR